MSNNFIKAEYTYIDKKLQDSITPDEAKKALIAGNKRFLDGNTVNRQFLDQIAGTVDGQFPHSVILSCIDSRVPTEIIFDQGIGDIFNARVAGNVVNDDVLGSLEYACKVAGSKLIVVLGHTSCGAVKSAVADVVLGNVTTLLAKIKPAIETLKQTHGDDLSNHIDDVVSRNVEVSIQDIKDKSNILSDMQTNGEIDIVGAVYDIKTGKVVFL